jgi:hypothetical protein
MEHVQTFGLFVQLAAYTPRKHSALYICLFSYAIEVAAAPAFCLSWPRRRGGYATSEENPVLPSQQCRLAQGCWSDSGLLMEMGLEHNKLADTRGRYLCWT